MKICFIYKEDFPWDVRVEKIVTLLAGHGHEVTLLAKNEARKPRRETADGFRIRRLPALPAALGKLNQLFGAPLFWNPVWFFAILSTLRQTKAEIAVVRDLPLMPTAIAAGRLLGVPVVFDMAECYPEMYASMLAFSSRKPVIWILKNPAFAAIIERFSVRRAACTFVMIEESRDRLLRMGVSPDKILIASNTPPKSAELPREHAARSVLRLIYVGFVTRIRGLDNMLAGIAAYVSSHPEGPAIEFNVVGKGAATQELQELAERLGISELVRFHGWQDQSVVDELYRTSDIGVLTYHVCGHWNHTIPNKLFDYMRSGMPVLATDVVPIRRIVDEVGCGLIFHDGDAEGCARALAELADPSRRSELGASGHEAVRESYNWEIDGARIVGYFDSLEARRS